MLTTYKQPSIVSGLSVNDILNMDIKEFNSLKESDLRKIVGRLVSAGNKRLRYFERNGEKSPATRYINKSGGPFSTKGKDLNALRAEYIRAKDFLQSKTGTMRGWKKVKNDTINTLKEKHKIDMTDDQWDDVWETYEKLKEESPDIAERGQKYEVLEEIVDELKHTTKSAEEIAIEMHKKLDAIYEKKQAEKLAEGGLLDGSSGVSGFFTIE